MPQPLITTDELAKRLDDVVVCDVRWRLTDRNAGRELYLDSHIPGAIFVDLDSDLSDPPGERGRHPLPSSDRFRSTLGALGIGNESQVVVYDDTAGMVAARLWWMLRAIGHTEVQLLDGGLIAWVDEARKTEAGENPPGAATYDGDADFARAVGIDHLDRRQVIDVRAAERYSGDTEPVDPRPGHIPGAINLPASELLENGRLLSPQRLRERFAEVTDPVLACGSGVNASFTALAFEIAFGSIPDVYPGSYSEWSRSTRPVNTGARP